MFSEQTATFAIYNINSSVFITEAGCIYSAVRTESLYNTDTFRLERGNIIISYIHHQIHMIRYKSYMSKKITTCFRTEVPSTGS